jgi:hypothetical protein
MTEPTPAAASAASLTKPYKLDWESADIVLKGGRFVHTLRKPTPVQLLERERALQTEIVIGKDGGAELPDPSLTENANIALYDQIVIESKGYKGAVPAAHKAAVITGLYQGYIELDEDSDIFGDEVTIVQELGGDDDPEYRIKHVLRQPTEDELRKFKAATAGGRIMPGKRGKQVIKTQSHLRQNAEFYDKLFVRIEGVTCADGEPKDAVDLLVKREVVGTLVKELTDNLLD